MLCKRVNSNQVSFSFLHIFLNDCYYLLPQCLSLCGRRRHVGVRGKKLVLFRLCSTALV